MNAFETFEQHLHTTLQHLYDPIYQPEEILWSALGCNPQDGVGRLQSVLIQAIKGLEPVSDVPTHAHIHRLYKVLLLRYVLGFTQERTAKQLGITPRHLRREQNNAIHMLASHLWGNRAVASPSDLGAEAAWRIQLEQELTTLQESAPGIVSDVFQVMKSVNALEHPLLALHGIALEIVPVMENLEVGIHPTAFRQIIIAAIRQMTQSMDSGILSLRAEVQNQNTHLLLSGSLSTTSTPTEDSFIHEILAMHGGALETRIEDGQMVLDIILPSAKKVTVLVVDDNADLVHFYMRYTAGTRYTIVHEREGLGIIETITAVAPEIIVLDIMLPDIDGWELLSYLYEMPATRKIPIIVCSVMREEELALALGATLYLPKPVRRQEFVQALDQAQKLSLSSGEPGEVF